MTYRLSRRPGKRAGGRTGGGALTLFQQFTALSGNLIADFDPSNPALVTLGAGANVSALASSVGGHVVSQAVEANQPDYSAIAINGRPGVVYNGSSDFLLGAAGLATALDQAQPYTWYYIADINSISAHRNVVSIGHTATVNASHSTFNSGSFAYSRFATPPGAGETGNGGTYAVGVHDVVEVYTGSAYSLFADGATAINNVASTSQPVCNIFCIGCIQVVSIIQLWSGSIGRILIYNVAHNAAQRAVVRAYLRGYYGI